MAISKVRTTVLATIGATCGISGYLLEAIRQRGDCDLGDKSPNTLGISIALIFIGGGFLGLISLVSAIRLIRRDGWIDGRIALIVAIVSVACVGPVFMFAGAGASSWFQYCGT